MAKLHFEIDYVSHWGENLSVVYSLDNDAHQELRLRTLDGHTWEGTVEVKKGFQEIRHAYKVCGSEGETLRIERNMWRKSIVPQASTSQTKGQRGRRTVKEFMFADTWADVEKFPRLNPASSPKGEGNPLTELSIPSESGSKAKSQPRAQTSNVFLQLQTFGTPQGKVWAVVGNRAELGNWNPEQALVGREVPGMPGKWVFPLFAAEDLEAGVEYKYILRDEHDGKNVAWEDGGNRNLRVKKTSATLIVRQDFNPRIAWAKWRAAGVVVPVFSLRSKGSFGIGDFGDLRMFIHWASEVGLKMVQLLPINDTTSTHTWHDSYPYNAISVFALHPAYLDAREWPESAAYAEVAEEGARLNELPEVDYEGATKLKARFARKLYEEIGKEICESNEFVRFHEDNLRWIESYASFCVYRDRFHTADFRQWPHKAESDEIAAPDLQEEKQFHLFLQYLLHRQMKAAYNEAHERGVLLKGDIPIGVSPNSVPAWKDGHLLRFDGQAGAPPDDFAVRGQNWGFPTYNWEEMAKDGYKWWKERFGHMAEYFDAYRIDHVLGFFRIWEIPKRHLFGVLGHFHPALPFSEDEIRSYGFWANLETYTHPFISYWRMDEIRWKMGENFVTTYFTPTDGGYTLKEAYSTQREIIRLVPEGNSRDVLLDAAAEVLFLRDPERPALLHPRVLGTKTWAYESLCDRDKGAFWWLHQNFFYDRHNFFWAMEALKKLPPITGTEDTAIPKVRLYPEEAPGMLPCAEDLGMVPASVKDVLERLGILSLEIERMPKKTGRRFAAIEENPYLSVATIATHDMPPLRLWWRQDREGAQIYWNHVLHYGGGAPGDLDEYCCEEIIRRHLACPSMLCLIGLQDLLSISPALRNPNPEAEQINVPANPNQNWNYRMHITLEHLIRSTDFNEKLSGLIRQCGR